MTFQVRGEMSGVASVVGCDDGGYLVGWGPLFLRTQKAVADGTLLEPPMPYAAITADASPQALLAAAVCFSDAGSVTILEGEDLLLDAPDPTAVV